MKKDSVGNPIPQMILLPLKSTTDQINHALTVNSFNIAASIALEKGFTVIYDATNKSATISDPNGMTTFIVHS